MINMLSTLGQVAMIAQPLTQVATVETKFEEAFSRPVETNKFKSHYESTKEGMTEFLGDLGTAYKVKMNIEEISSKLNKNPELLKSIIEEVNSKLSKRGFFSWFKGVGKTLAGFISSAATFGQVDATTKLGKINSTL